MFAQKYLQKTLIFASGAVFLGLMVFPLLNMYKSGQSPDSSVPSPTQPAQNTQAENASREQQFQALQERERGYEIVLQREPNNPAALQGLTETRLKMNDLQGAIEPLEKLIKIYPQEEKLQALLAVIKQQVGTPTQPVQQPKEQPKEQPQNGR